MNPLTSSNDLFLVGPAAVMDGIDTSFQLRSEAVMVDGCYYHVLRGHASNVMDAIKSLKKRGALFFNCVLDRVFLISNNDGHWAAGTAFFQVAAPEYESMISNERNSSCARHLIFIAESFRHGNCQGTILDFGCGTGVSSLALIHAGYKVIGFDASESMRAHARATGLRVENSLSSFEDASVSAAIACYVFHFGVLEPDILELSRIICDGGIVAANFHKGLAVDQASLMFPRAGFEVCPINFSKETMFGTVMAFRRGKR